MGVRLMRNKIWQAIGFASILIASQAGCAQEPINYMDAHSHLQLPGVSTAEEIAAFKNAGIAAVVIMHPEPEQLEVLASQYPGYVIPFISIARLPETAGIRLSEDSAERFAALYEAGAVCGFGEIPTRLVPATDPNDAAALLNPNRKKIYAYANAHSVPVNMHVDLNTPEVIAAFGSIAASYPSMKVILAHAGWTAGPEVVEKLLSEHPNIYVDLSIRLDPLVGFGNPPVPRPNGPNPLSILTAEGALQGPWQELVSRHADRFMFAMDVSSTGVNGRHKLIGELRADAEHAFNGLPRSAQEAIAHGNLEGLIQSCPRRPQ
jgi:Amidohydrolase